MTFTKKSGLVYAAILFAGLLTVPAAAQQEVAPDHFEDHAAVAQGKKPAAKSQASAARRRTSTTASAQAKPKNAQPAVLKADAGKTEPIQNAR